MYLTQVVESPPTNLLQTSYLASRVRSKSSQGSVNVDIPPDALLIRILTHHLILVGKIYFTY